MIAELLEISNKKESKTIIQGNNSNLRIQSDLMQVQINLEEEQEDSYKEKVVEDRGSKELSSVSITKWLARLSPKLKEANAMQESTDLNGCYGLEIDSRADTACCGKGWKVLYYTGQVAHDSFEEIKDVPISASCYTVCVHPEGHTYILIANEALFFGDSLEHSLILPAQI